MGGVGRDGREGIREEGMAETEPGREEAPWGGKTPSAATRSTDSGR